MLHVRMAAYVSFRWFSVLKAVILTQTYQQCKKSNKLISILQVQTVSLKVVFYNQLGILSKQQSTLISSAYCMKHSVTISFAYVKLF